MLNKVKPVPGSWYTNMTNEQAFEVIAIEKSPDLIDIQFANGSFEKITFDTWWTMQIALMFSFEQPLEEDDRVTEIKIRNETQVDTLKVTSLLGNSQKLDGGALFGHVPKALWMQWVTPDEDNKIPLACRCMLIEEPNRRILLEAGIGYFFEEKERTRYGVIEKRHILLDSLAKLGLSHEDIDIVVLSHLHFDHAGGLLSAIDSHNPLALLFPNARFVVSEDAWERANHPHVRDKASFIPTLNQLLAESNRLILVNDATTAVLGENYRFHYSNGHTPGLLLTEVVLSDGPLVFAADLIPGIAWVHLPVTMGYDRASEQLIDEKQALLSYLVDKGGRLFFTHDKRVALCKVSKDSRGRFVAVQEQLQAFHLH